MAATGIDIKKLASLTTVVIVIEVLAVMAGTRLTAHSLMLTGAARSCQILAIVFVLVAADGNLSAIGIRHPTLMRGIARGLLWSAGFGLIVALAAVLLHLAGKDPTALIRGRLPGANSQVVLLFAVGGMIGPIAEEMLFRGVLYGFFRRWGVLPALLISTGIFVLVHLLVRPMQAFAIIQAVGGVLFAAAYELEKNLMVPITIHCLGNMAIFALPALV